jgi:DNA-binding transcriptional ArsR family regulator
MTARYAELAAHLEALASPTRLELLHTLRTPTALGDIRVAASLTREGERPERPLARQSVSHHLEQLAAQGLVQQVEAGGKDAYVLNPQRLFALVDEIRGLAKLRPLLPPPGEEATLAQPGSPRTSLPPLPRLLVAYGREDGAAFALEGPGPWRIGRNSACEVPLDHDPFASGEHALVARDGAGFAVRDLRSRNGTWLDWERLRPEAVLPLRPGGVLTVGRSVLVLQA